MAANGTPQGYLYSQRPVNTTRDRSMEQNNTNSGNPYGYVPQQQQSPYQSPYQLPAYGTGTTSPYNYNQYNPGRYVPPQVVGGPWTAQQFTTGPMNYNMPSASNGYGGNPWNSGYQQPPGLGGQNPYQNWMPQFNQNPGQMQGGGQFNPYGYPGQQLFPYGQPQNNPQFYPQFQQSANLLQGQQNFASNQGVGYNAPNNVQQYSPMLQFAQGPAGQGFRDRFFPSAQQNNPQSYNPQQQLADRMGQLPGGAFNLMGAGNGRYLPNFTRQP